MSLIDIWISLLIILISPARNKVHSAMLAIIKQYFPGVSANPTGRRGRACIRGFFHVSFLMFCTFLREAFGFQKFNIVQNMGKSRNIGRM